jgi:biopolymer transport protein ExbD
MNFCADNTAVRKRLAHAIHRKNKSTPDHHHVPIDILIVLLIFLMVTTLSNSSRPETRAAESKQANRGLRRSSRGDYCPAGTLFLPRRSAVTLERLQRCVQRAESQISISIRADAKARSTGHQGDGCARRRYQNAIELFTKIWSAINQTRLDSTR